MESIIAKYLQNSLMIALVLPFISSLVPLIFRNFQKFTETLLVIITIVIFLNLINLFFYSTHNEISITLTHLMNNLAISFKVRSLDLIFAFMVSFLWIINIIYSMGYIKAQNNPISIALHKDIHFVTFYSFMNLAISACFIIAFASNLLTTFIGYELLTIATYPLVAESGTIHAKKAARTYISVLLISSTIFLLPAIITIYNLTGTLEFSKNGILAGKVNVIGITTLLFCFIYGVSKTAIMPLHKWLPSAMVAPAPVSALLHAVAVVKAGIFIINKVVIYIFGVTNLASIAKEFIWLNNWLVFAACSTIIISSVIALYQDSLKKILAYSTIAQLSYCLMAISLFTPKALVAAIFHMITHGISKICLFFVAGTIYTSTHKTDISELNGVGKLMPTISIAFTISALSIIGIPPLAGFISKYYILDSTWNSNYTLVVLATIVISTILNAAYFLPIIYKLFWGAMPQDEELYRAPSFTMTFSIVVTALISLTMFLFTDKILKILSSAI